MNTDLNDHVLPTTHYPIPQHSFSPHELLLFYYILLRNVKLYPLIPISAIDITN